MLSRTCSSDRPFSHKKVHSSASLDIILSTAISRVSHMPARMYTFLERDPLVICIFNQAASIAILELSDISSHFVFYFGQLPFTTIDCSQLRSAP